MGNTLQQQQGILQKFEAQICSLAWKPKGNALSVRFRWHVWGVGARCASHMTLPKDNSIQPPEIDREEVLCFSDDDEEDFDENKNHSSSQEKEQSLSPTIAHKELQVERYRA